MKKIFMLLAVCATVSFATAQTTVRGSKFTDNWSVGLQAGGLTPAANHKVIGDLRPIVGVTIAKEITPVFGLAVEGNTLINGGHNTFAHSANAFDALNVNGLLSFNLTNLIYGYQGSPRLFDVKAVYGFGWGHEFYPNTTTSDINVMTSKAGLNIGINIDEAKAWQINVKPAVVWALNGYRTNSAAAYNINDAWLELTAGVTYKFKNSNGTHNFTLVKEYDQAEVDGLNAKINDLRNQLGVKDQKIAADANAIKKLQAELNDCRNQKKPVAAQTQGESTSEHYVYFACGKSVIAASQRPTVERVADFLKKNPNAEVRIEGYASTEGPKALNDKLAKARAQAVKNMLIKRYKVAESRIKAAEGKGTTDMFSKRAWNRVAISTITK